MILFLLQIYFNIFKKVFPLKKYDKKDVFSTKLDVLFSLWKSFPETQTFFQIASSDQRNWGCCLNDQRTASPLCDHPSDDFAS